MPDTRTQDAMIRIGASWYPEMWPSSHWPQDVARMQELGFNMVRLFEFAWARFEPSEGQFEFDWALQIMDLCHEAGIGVMVGTPTAAPPAWLTGKYPETLKVDAQGKRASHGKRRHYNPMSEKYLELCRRITEQMAHAFADHPALHSWQIDNEINGRDYSPESLGKFHRYLAEKFGDVQTMNRSWGLQFWSQAYSDFEQVPMPVAEVGGIEIPERHHPSLIMAVARFQNQGWQRFIDEQVAVIRQRSEKPITTNMCGSGLSLDWFALNRDLDRVGYSIYKDVDHYAWNLWSLDRMRGEKQAPFWVLETAPNWSGGGRQWNIHHNAAGLECLFWLTTLAGSTMTLFWQWREHWAGQEMQHGTCVTATGQWRPNKAMWQQLSAAGREHGDWLLSHPPKSADVGLMCAGEAAWAFSIDPIDVEMHYDQVIRDQYLLPMCNTHLWREVISETSDPDRYPVICIPHMPILHGATRVRLEQWVSAGGCLLLGPLTGYRSEEFTCFTDQAFGGLETLIGAESDLRFTAQWREDAVTVDFADGRQSRTRAWCEAFAPVDGDPIAWYRGDGEYGADRVAAVRHELGKGQVVTLGCMVDPAVYLHLLTGLLRVRGLGPIARGGDGVYVFPRADAEGRVAGYGVVNLSDQRQKVSLPAGGRDVLAGEVLGSDVWTEPLQARLIVLEQQLQVGCHVV